MITMITMNNRLLFGLVKKSCDYLRHHQTKSVVRDFSKEIPSARGLPFLGTTLSLLLAGGPPRLHEYIDLRHKQLGPVFKERIGPTEAVFIADSEDMRSVFRHEGPHPKHILPDAWTLYNNTQRRKRGILFMEGDEWLHFRRILNRHLLKAENQKWIELCCNESATQFIRRIDKSGNRFLLRNLEGELYKNSIETMAAVLLGTADHNSEPAVQKLIEELTSAVSLIFENTSKLMLIPAPLAYKLNLTVWTNFVQSADKCLRLANELIDEFFKRDFVKAEGLLFRMQKEQMGIKDVKRMIIDMILAAGDTTAHSTQWILYLLSKHREVQEKVFVQLKKGEGNDLLKYIMKEALRLYPVAPFLARILPEDINLGDHFIPKNTLIVMSLYTSSRNPKNFPDPHKFLPERWIRTPGGYQSANPYASLPFAMGARSCIGKKIAEAQMSSVVKQLAEKFEMKLKNEEKVEMILRMVSVPSTPIQIELTKRF